MYNSTNLGVGAMRLYGYLSTREELLERIVAAVYGEMVVAETIANEYGIAAEMFPAAVR